MLWKNFRRLFCTDSSSSSSSSSSINYAALLQQCIKAKDLSQGRRIHSELAELGYDKQTLLGTLLVQMYGQCGCVDEASSCFLNIRNPIVFSSNVMITALASNGYLLDAKKFFDNMAVKDAVSYNAMISAYSHSGCVIEAKNLFDEMPLKNVVSFNSMITAFAQNGYVAEARSLFDSMKLRDNVSWNAMVAAYSQRGMIDQAKEFFDEAPARNLVTWNALVTGYAQEGELEMASKIFVLMPEWSEICWNAMISGFARRRRPEDAWKLFVKLPFRGMISWITMLQGYVQNDRLEEACKIFERMPLTDVVSWTAIVTALAHNDHLEEAKKLFKLMPCKDITAENAMIAAYGLYGDVDEAKVLFDGMERRDLISWNALITAYAQNGHAKQALSLFRAMDLDGTHPDNITFVGALDACAVISVVSFGKLVHRELLMSSRVFVEAGLATALVNFYGKCGRLEEARELFDNMSFCDVILLNAMLSAYAQNGEGREALKLFNRGALIGIEPDTITFISVMSACSHGGLLRDGYASFVLLAGDFGLIPTVDHYSCMVDLLARTGQLMDAEDLLLGMPWEPQYTAWRSLLSACQSYRDVARGTRVARLALEAEPRCSSPFVMLSRLYSAAGKHGEGSLVRRAMDERGLKKPAGLSCITIKDRIHEFIAGGKNHPQLESVVREIKRLAMVMKEAGHVIDTSSVLHDFEEEEKEIALNYHSEKLAIAFGILNTPHKQPLYVVKNLRVCSDCHAAIKFISLVSRRKITVRDAHRFHHFETGVCSCGDFW